LNSSTLNIGSVSTWRENRHGNQRVVDICAGENAAFDLANSLSFISAWLYMNSGGCVDARDSALNSSGGIISACCVVLVTSI